jgi:hypothetical protein
MWKTIDRELLARLPAKPGIDSEATWGTVAQKLEEFREIYTLDDWDGQGSAAIPRDVIESAKDFASALELRGIASAGWIVPTYDSSLAFEWDTADGAVEVEVKTPRDLELTVKPRLGEYEVLRFADIVENREVAVR